MEKPQGFKVWLTRFLFATSVIVVYKTFDNLNVIFKGLGSFLGVLTPFFTGLVIAFFLYLPSHKLETLLGKTKNKLILAHTRMFSILVVYLLFFLLMALFLILFIPTLYQNGRAFLTQMPDYIRSIRELLQEYAQKIGELSSVNEMLDSLTIPNILSWLNLDNIGTYTKFAQDLVSRLLDFFLGVVISIYLLTDRKRLVKGAQKASLLVLRPHTAQRLVHFLTKSCRVLYSFFYGQVLDAIFVGVCGAIGLQVIGVPNAMILGVVYGMFSLIPYFGAIIGIAIVLLFTFLSVGLGRFFIAAVFIIVLQQIDGNIVNPKIIGNSLGIRPIWVIFGVTAGGGLFGVPGMLLGPPVVAILLEWLSAFAGNHSDKKEEPLKKPSEEGEAGTDDDSFNEEKMETP